MSVRSKHYYRSIFLKSQEWDRLRLKCLIIFDAKRNVCGSSSFFNDIHHVVYPESTIWDTKQRHLRPLCRRCHSMVHAVASLLKFPEEHRWNREQLQWKRYVRIRALLKWHFQIPLDRKELKHINTVLGTGKPVGAEVTSSHAKLVECGQRHS